MSVIEATELTKKYGDFTAVDAISFEVAPGESFGLLGPNGAGKSTTMRMIGGTSLRTSGSLRVLGLDPEQNGPEVRASLGVVPQQDSLDEELRARDNLIVYGRNTIEPVMLRDRVADRLFALRNDRKVADSLKIAFEAPCRPNSLRYARPLRG